jgi:hypothetical protein
MTIIEEEVDDVELPTSNERNNIKESVTNVDS